MEFNFFITLLVFSTLAQQWVRAESTEFSNSRDKLQQSQMALAARFSAFAPSLGLKPEIRNSDQEDERKDPIFRIYSTVNDLKAPAGKLLFGHLRNRVIVGSEKHPVIVTLKGDQTAFSNLKLLGFAAQAATPGRVSIEIQKIVFRSGLSHPLNALGLDRDGALGLEAQVVSGKALGVAGSLASSFISGLAASQQTTRANAFGFESTQVSPRNSLLGGLAQTAADQSKRLIEDSTSEKPVMILEAGTEITVMIQDEVRF